MRSLQTKLLQAFLVITLVFVVTMGGIYWLNTYLVNQYKSVSTSMIAEYQLTEAVSQLITAYNNRFLSTNTNEAAADQQIRATKTRITDLMNQIDRLITDHQSRSSFDGLKNTVDDVVDEINLGLVTLETGDVRNASIYYTAANRKYTYVTQNSSTFLFDQLQYSSTLQSQIDKSYRTLSIAVTSLVLVVIVTTIIYGYRFSRRLVLPLKELTEVAREISRGNLNSNISTDLEARTDEVGSLSRSFSRMLAKLREYIEQLNQENISIEHKVTERTLQLQQEKARLAASVNSFSLGFIMTDADGNLLLINDPAKTILSYEVSDYGVSAVNPSSFSQEWTIKLITKCLEGHVDLRGELLSSLSSSRPYLRKEIDYNGRVLRLFLARIIDNEKDVLGSVILLEDITEEKVLQRSRDEFFSIASHELRTPLTAIRGNSGMIEQFFGEQIKDKEFHNMVGDIHESSIRLITIVNDFLDASKLEQDKIVLKVEAFHVKDVIVSVINDMAMLAEGKNNKVLVDPSVEKAKKIMADKDRVKQITYNLIGNAMKFTENGIIAVRCEQIDQLLKVFIDDTGIGIPEKSQGLLFHKFQQAGNSLYTRDATKGTGLGLYISKLLAEKMGGRVNLESSHINKGTTFSFTIPIAND